jgi:hypothetical protein
LDKATNLRCGFIEFCAACPETSVVARRRFLPRTRDWE